MLAIERKRYIQDLLKREKKVIVADLAIHFGVTEETIRRDLEKLENEGFAQKIYGGAVLNESFNVDLPYLIRRRSNVEAKQYIADIIAERIQDGDNIMLDSSSTALFVVKNIKSKKNITVVTNSTEIVCELADRTNWKIYATGGLVKEGGYAFIGARAVDMIKSFHVDMAIFSCKGVDLEFGLTDSNDDDAEIKKAIIASAKKKILTVDRSKFDRTSLVNISDVDVVDMVVTDSCPDERWINYFDEKGIELLY
jgi:DeoR/GlpR family transcriptional regulator of sugar metabolism